jgi:hypothetical protein
MTIDAPSYLTIVGGPLTYRWNGDIAMGIAEAEDDALYDAIDAAGFKAKFAVGIVLTEWVVWRLHGHVDLVDAVRLVEAAWAGADLAAVEVGNVADDDTEPVRGPLLFALANLREIAADYASGNVYLAEIVLRQALLARHVMPYRKEFDRRLAEVLIGTARAHPRGVDYDEVSEFHDASDEAPVPRSFFR